MSAGEKYEKSTKTHTQQQHERRGGGKPTLRRMRQLISFRVNGEAGKGKKKQGLIKRLQCFYWQCIISCFKCPIKGTEIGSLALAACAPESLEGERPTSLRVKLLVEKPRKKKKRDDSSHLWHHREGKYLRGHSQMRITNTMVHEVSSSGHKDFLNIHMDPTPVFCMLPALQLNRYANGNIWTLLCFMWNAQYILCVVFNVACIFNGVLWTVPNGINNVVVTWNELKEIQPLTGLWFFLLPTPFSGPDLRQKMQISNREAETVKASLVSQIISWGFRMNSALYTAFNVIRNILTHILGYWFCLEILLRLAKSTKCDVLARNHQTKPAT